MMNNREPGKKKADLTALGGSGSDHLRAGQGMMPGLGVTARKLSASSNCASGFSAGQISQLRARTAELSKAVNRDLCNCSSYLQIRD